MATRKRKNPELAAAADNLAAAAHHVRAAVSKKVDALRAAASAELAKGRRQFDAQLRKVTTALASLLTVDAVPSAKWTEPGCSGGGMAIARPGKYGL